MRLHTLAGDVIDLRFLWPPETLHVGRQAARRYAERAEHVVAMRRDPDKAGGWETLVSSRPSADGAERLDTYSLVLGLTEQELAIPEGELFVRDKVEPMVNVERADLTEPLIGPALPAMPSAPFQDITRRTAAIRARFLAYINQALVNNAKAP
jgi:NAD(P)-dependent dehydrogenase (short-subunit alcohol dehydrogenase family)